MNSVMLFTVDDVCSLAKLSRRQLTYWDSTEFFSPTYSDETRFYSFRDLVGLRTISNLRNQHHVPLQELRKVGEWLREKYETPWASLRFYVLGKRAYFDDPESGARMAGHPRGQTALPIEMQRIANDLNIEVRKLHERQPDQLGKIVQLRGVMNNEPIVAGTRIPTSAIWRLHQANYSIDAILKQYPRLTRRDVEAAIAHEKKHQRKRKRKNGHAA
jgi:uncharacterized protein (DUF433 family)